MLDFSTPKVCPECGSLKIAENPLKFGIVPEKWLCEDCGFSWSRPKDLQEILATIKEDYKK